MSPDRNRLHIAIQKSGRLSERSRQLLKDAGLKLSESGNNPLTARAENFPLDLMFVRDDDIPTFVGDGVCELGIVGQNVRMALSGLPCEVYDVVAGLGGRPITRASLRRLLDEVMDARIDPHRLHFLDLDTALVERELTRSKSEGRPGPHAQNVLRDLGVVAAGSHGGGLEE